MRTVNMDLYAESPYNRKVTFSSGAPFTPSYVVSQLSLSSDPTAMYASRVRGRQMLLDNPMRESRTKKEMDEKRLRRKKQKESKSLGIIGKREAKEKGVWKFDESQAKYFFQNFERNSFTDGIIIVDSPFLCPCIIYGWDTCQSY